MLVASWLMCTTVVIPQDTCWEADDHIIHANAVKGTKETAPLAVTFAVMRQHAACQTGEPSPLNPNLQRLT